MFCLFISPSLCVWLIHYWYDYSSWYDCSSSARNKDQKLVGCFFENRMFYRLLITVPLKMYRKYGQPKYILVDQVFKFCQKMANG